MSNASWELVASKRPLLNKMKCIKHLLRIQDMRVCWLSWRSACGRCQHPCVPSLALVRQLALLSRDICDSTVEIRCSLKDDYAAYIQNIVCLLLKDTTSKFSTHWSRDSSGRSPLCHPMLGSRIAQWLRPPNRLRNLWLRFHAATFSAHDGLIDG